MKHSALRCPSCETAMRSVSPVIPSGVIARGAVPLSSVTYARTPLPGSVPITISRSVLPNHPANVTLVNSGNPGTDFFVGGSIDLTTNTPEGLYEGDMEITVQYP